VREAESLKRAGTWPIALTPLPVRSGLQLHLDAADPSTLFNATTGGSLVAADGAVARWEDKSGNGRHATQATSDSRPLRKNAVQNGLGVLRFDGGNDWLNLPTNFRWWPTGTLFAVLDNAGDGIFWYALKRADDNPEIRLVTSQDSGFWYYDGSYKVNQPNHYDAIGGGTVRTVVLANTSYKSYSNGILKNSTTLASAVTANNSAFSHTIGGFKVPDDDFSSYAAIDIAEIVMYDSALSDADRSAVESYLMSKWGITPPSAPSAPTSLFASGGNAQASLTWTAPASDGGTAITDYAVQFSSNGGSTWNTFADGTSTATSATVTGLTNGTAYVFRVAAVNAAGTGAYTAASSSVTPSPPAPTLTRITNGTNGSFTGSGTAADPFVAASYFGGLPSSVRFQISSSGTIQVRYNATNNPDDYILFGFYLDNGVPIREFDGAGAGTDQAFSFALTENAIFRIAIYFAGSFTNLRIWSTA
jgi:hypothetical protein